MSWSGELLIRFKVTCNQQSMCDRLVELPVAEFVHLVSTADQPVPAGAGVAALTGASSAALLA
jgi:hypothetical protein